MTGILLVQGVTALLVYTAMKTDLSQTWVLFGALGVALGAVTALWFNAVAEGARRTCLARMQASFSREREKLRVRAEQEKNREVKSAQRQVHRQQQRTETTSHIKTGVVIGGAVSAGVVLLLTQMVTLGLLALTTAGGAALGYGVRARQERLAASGRGLFGPRENLVQVIESEPPKPALERAPRRRPNRARLERETEPSPPT